MQPISGLHIASLIDRALFDVRLYHEDWHGPFDGTEATGYDLVFLTGLQPDFDRMRQLAFFFRRAGATVVAGGSICTLFPEFATRFFDAVCAGGVDSVREAVADYVRGALKRIYRSPATRISTYTVDYRLLAENGISPKSHLVEASRGCSFQCSFCVIPVEMNGHATYDLAALRASIDAAIATSPFFSFRRWYPTVILIDNNFSDDRRHMLRVCEMLRNDRRIRGWAALVTQNILHDRELIRHLAEARCFTLFVGLESLDREFLRRYNKKQNLSRRDVIDDIAFAEAQGIGIGYGYLFDPRYQTAAVMEEHMRIIAESRTMPMPVYLSVVAPLAGTASFWVDLAAGQLAANLRLRDLDGETICYRDLADAPEALVGFVERIFRRPWTVVGRLRVLLKTLRRIVYSRSFDPFHWYVIAAANLHCFVWARASPCRARSYRAGDEVLDPQYSEYPADISEEDRQRYFEPIALTDAAGRPVEWLRPYIPAAAAKREPVLTAEDAD
ncbi:MAG TPA: radical SAM protein [Stellaceae bacterium]|nr:radical SAM protein [Stellaceae bacterium]